MNDGAWCAVAATDRFDPLAALQGRRIALQARSKVFGYLGAQAGFWISAFRSQVETRDRGPRKAVENLRSLVSERGAARKMARAFLARRRHLMHVLPYLGWLIAQ